MIILTRIQHTAVLIVLIGALVSSTLIICVSAYTSIDVVTAHDMIGSGAYPNLVLLDVRTKGEYDGGHIYGATLIPVTELLARIGELASRKHDSILVYCGSGGRSVTASGILDSNGFTEVYNMLGGITAWKSAGYPTWIGTVHNINTTYNYDAIQAAIDSALTMNGNTILVDIGIYREHVVVGKTLSIVGADSRNTVIDGNGTGTVISVKADNVKVESFTIRNGSESGVRLIDGNCVQIRNNKITNNYCGVNVLSSYNMIFNNEITGNQYFGVLITGGSSTIFENNITSNNYGIYVNSSQPSNGNLIYHNNLNNTHQAVTSAVAGLWDIGYPSGGNYWSDYNDIDTCTGPFQNETGSDGIGDTPYVIDADNQDRYPLMNPHTPQPGVAVINVSPFKTVVGLDYCLNTSVTVANLGDYPQAFNVTVYADGTQIETQPITLENDTSTTTTFTWNTTDFAYGNYTLSAYAWPIPEEADVADNNHTCTYNVHVGVAGDVSGPAVGVYDGTTNMRDIQYLILLFNTNPDSPNWKPNADVNNDGTVNMRDIQIAILNFNQYE
jgi:parallel beta-helix repeat protein